MNKSRPGFSILTRASALVCGLALVAAPSPVDAQSRSGSEDTFVDLGRWVIVQDERARSCELRLTSDPQVVLRYRMADGQPSTLALQRRSGRFFTGMVGDVEWAFDNVRFAGYVGSGGYGLSSSSRSVEAEFRGARFLSVSHAGQEVARLSLKTSSAGFRLLRQCAEQWRFVRWDRRTVDSPTRTRPVASPAAPPAARAAQTASAPAPATSRQAGIAPPLTTPLRPRPINRSSWISSADNLPLPNRGFREGRGVLRFTLIVSEDGRAEECEVDRSTGSRRLDRQTCRLLMDRARFEPARSSTGQNVEGRYSSSVRFAEE